MMDFEVDRCTQRCAATGRDLAPGETIYSILVVDGGRVARRDYAAEAWSGPEPNSLGWWKAQVPARNAKKKQMTPSEVLLALLEIDASGDAERSAGEETLAEESPDEASDRDPLPGGDEMPEMPAMAAERPPEDFRYVLSLLLVRRRILRLEETETSPEGREISVLYCPRNEKTYRIATDVPGADRAREIQEQLSQLLAPSNP